MMDLTIGPWKFDHVSYDADADVAYLSIGEPQRAVGEETPEGHIARFSEETGQFCGLTLIGVREIVDGPQPTTITIPFPSAPVEPPRAVSADLESLVCA